MCNFLKEKRKHCKGILIKLKVKACYKNHNGLQVHNVTVVS